MTLEERKAVNRAWLDGKMVQLKSSTIEEDWEDYNGTELNFYSKSLVWRIKPEPKLRRWKPEEVPVGCLLKDNSVEFGLNSVSVLICRRGAWSYFCDHDSANIRAVSTKFLLENFTHSTDGGKTWKPCGVEK